MSEWQMNVVSLVGKVCVSPGGKRRKGPPPISPTELFGGTNASCSHNSGLCRFGSFHSQRRWACIEGPSKSFIEHWALAATQALFALCARRLRDKERNYHQRFLQSKLWFFQMWELDRKEGWTLRNWCFRIVVLEKTLESPMTARRSNQSILKEINLEYSLEGLALKLKLQYFGHLMRRANSFEKTLMLERWGTRGEGGDRGWDGWMVSLTQRTWVWASSGRWWKTGVLQSMGLQRVGRDRATEQQQQGHLNLMNQGEAGCCYTEGTGRLCFAFGSSWHHFAYF